MICIESFDDEVFIRLQVSFPNGHTYMDVNMLNTAVDRHSQASPTPSPTPAPGPDAGPDNDTNEAAFRSENLPNGNSDIDVLKY
ncbi:hypothetical protein AOL_s00215g361 [Orbilia oligospora ATCC 24927]|uniref:Uncharacterized protein n=1 Tax=Arthrobotrys oligospora (strain ATCC 24927 / CBS 115.81 / DSM 1491) TaxID=756982 RepID=G1XU82_ARTOA|nr:hypothetical protein AOL_s00215g361 [Orbilia oligospora ATCC 24927]EGX43625.1 hypothetical protein AOL_s00215g361 [Orbilia oligospora ATCC 24927]